MDTWAFSVTVDTLNLYALHALTLSELVYYCNFSRGITLVGATYFCDTQRIPQGGSLRGQPSKCFAGSKCFANVALTFECIGCVALTLLIVFCCRAKKSGPVNGDECYFWRTTGCTFGSNCRYKHVPRHKGVDLTDDMLHTFPQQQQY